MIKSLFAIKIKPLVILLSIIMFYTACKKDTTTPPAEPDPADPSKARINLVSGNKQSGTFGDDLPNELNLQITIPEGKKIEHYYVQFKMVQGNGTISSQGNNTPYLLPDGTLHIKWQLGCNTNQQSAKAYVYGYTYDPSDPAYGKPPVPQDSVEIQASGTKPNGWGRACGCGIPDMFNTDVITYDKKTLYLASRELYSSTDGGMNWYKVSGVPKWSEVISAQFNNKGWLYVLTRYDGIFVSKNLITWQQVNNGILDKRDPTAFMIKDDVLMVSFYFDGPYLSRNDGAFWQKLLVAGNSQRYLLFNQDKNKNLYLFDDWGTFFRSKDMGKTWQSLQLDYGYYLSQPSGFAIGPDDYLYIGSGDATFAQVSPVTLKGTARRYYEWNSSSQSVDNIRFYNEDVFYLVRSTPNPGIYSINNNWNKIDLNFPKTIVSYFIKPDGNFLLLSYDGLYYRN